MLLEKMVYLVTKALLVHDVECVITERSPFGRVHVMMLDGYDNRWLEYVWDQWC